MGACCRNLFRATAKLDGIGPDGLTDTHRRTWCSEYNIYRATMIYSLIASVLIVAGLESPVYLVLVASALASFISPVIFFLNFSYCLVIIRRMDKAFDPSTFARWFSWSSLLVSIGTSLNLIFCKSCVPISRG